MRPEEVMRLLTEVQGGACSPQEAFLRLSSLPYDDIGFARIDTHRELRQGLPEAIYSEHKLPEEVVAIASRMLETTSGAVLATRVTPEAARLLLEAHPEARHHDRARVVVLRSTPEGEIPGEVVVVAAGTSDLAVAEEAAVIARALGARAELITDVGVAGIHRLLAVQGRLRDADVLIVVAGMEGALASAAGGMTGAPVIAVPTSVGYGASLGGVAALLSMLSSCAPGVTVTNIDAGFTAAYAALRILRCKKA
ncbi:MAG TPA: nickel pincer cofactor biosynthesis protein LarB [Actinomycetota bacterium]|jgi:NCAIR mutase (PurE)-related protein|nr:nickel pincer cofactor biosynthesis protein LarB [Actinomycetota bacterium]